MDPLERRQYSSLPTYLKSYETNKLQSLHDQFWMVYNTWWTTQLLGHPPKFEIRSHILGKSQFEELQVLGDNNRL